MLVVTNIFIYGIIFFNAILQLADKYLNAWYQDFTWNFYSMTLTIEFGRSLLKLHQFTKVLSKKGFISNWKLMLAHFGSLFTATLTNTVCFIIMSITVKRNVPEGPMLTQHSKND